MSTSIYTKFAHTTRTIFLVCLWASLWFSPPTLAGEYRFYKDTDSKLSFEPSDDTNEGKTPDSWATSKPPAGIGIFNLKGKINGDTAYFTVTKNSYSINNTLVQAELCT